MSRVSQGRQDSQAPLDLQGPEVSRVREVKMDSLVSPEAAERSDPLDQRASPGPQVPQALPENRGQGGNQEMMDSQVAKGSEGFQGNLEMQGSLAHQDSKAREDKQANPAPLDPQGSRDLRVTVEIQEPREHRERGERTANQGNQVGGGDRCMVDPAHFQLNSFEPKYSNLLTNANINYN